MIMEMVEDGFSVEISSSFDKFWCYNVAVTCGCFDDNGNRTGFASVEDTVADVGADLTAPPADYRQPRIVSFSTERCARLLMYLYIIPHTLPSDNDIGGSKPFELRVTARRGTEMVFDRIFTVNRWSGASIELNIPENK